MLRCHSAQQTLSGDVVDLDAPVVAVARERGPTRERVAYRFGKSGFIRDLARRQK